MAINEKILEYFVNHMNTYGVSHGAALSMGMTLHKFGVADTPENIDKYIRLFILSDHIKSIKGRNWRNLLGDGLYSGEIKINPVPGKVTKIKEFNPLVVLKKIASMENIKVALTGVLFDKRHNAYVATDSHRMAVIYDKNIQRQGLFDPKTGKEIKQTTPDVHSSERVVYPDWQKILRGNYHRYITEINVQEWYNRVLAAYNIEKFAGKYSSFYTLLLYRDDEYFLETSYLLDTLELFLRLGINKVNLGIPNSKYDALYFYTNKIINLIMPMRLSRDELRDGYYYVLYQKEYSRKGTDVSALLQGASEHKGLGASNLFGTEKIIKTQERRPVMKKSLSQKAKDAQKTIRRGTTKLIKDKEIKIPAGTQLVKPTLRTVTPALKKAQKKNLEKGKAFQFTAKKVAKKKSKK